MAIRKRTWRSGGETKTAWVVDYKDQRGKRRLKTFARKKDADDWAKTALYQVKHGTHTPDSASVTLGEACDKWLERGRAEDLESHTIRQYEGHVKHHIKAYGPASVKLSQLNTPMVQDFRDTLLERNSRPMAQKVLASLKSVLTEAQRRGLVAQNVARPVTINIPKRHRRRHEIGVTVPTKEEVKAVIGAAEGKWRAFLITAAFTGLRSSELRGLRWQDVDFAAKVIRVRQRADELGSIGSPKSEAGNRDVPMAPIVANTLKEWKLACPRRNVGAKGKNDPGELWLVFPNGNGNVENHANIYNRGYAPVQIDCGIAVDTGEKDEEGQPIMKAKYGLHSLRHFFASWLIGQGFAPKRLQTIMGHSSMQMTYDVYGHWFPNEEDDHARLAAGELAVIG